jgi:hypothetical protein
VAETATITRGPDAPEGDAPLARPQPTPPRSPEEQSRRRFTTAVLVGTVAVLPLLLWLMWDLWSGTVNPLRGVPYDNFYDLQARAMFHGHLYLPSGKMGIEAFVRNGRDYTYFGIFPSLLRMPVLLVTSSLDGKMTAPSILLAWMSTALVSSLMLWRLRILIRGRAIVGRAEAASFGALMATIMGGSVILYLGATPFIYNEDFAWSIPLTVGSMFCLLGVLEHPTRGRVVASGLFILGCNLNRTPAGYACSIGAFLVAAWFATGRGGTAERRWALPLAGIGVVTFLVSCAVTYAKFGIPVGLPMADQVWATVNAHRRYLLAANGGKAFSFAFLPSTLWAYLQPLGLRVSGIFPFVTPPGAPAAWLAGAVMDQSYPTASLTDTSPLLLLLAVWGTVTAFRPKGIGLVRLTRFVLIAAAAGAGGVLLWGYISQRYIADLMPFFIIAASIGLIDIWRRLAGRQRGARGAVLGVVVAGAVYCIAANLAIAAFPVAQWSSTQDANYVSAQKSLSIDSLADTVQHGATLPYWAPAGELFDVNHCSGLYLSTGNDMKDVPGQQIEHYTWVPVEQDPSYTQTVGFTFNRVASKYFTQSVPLLKYGASTLILQPDGRGSARLLLENSGTTIDWPPAAGWKIPIKYVHVQYQFVVTTDPNLNSMVILWYGSGMLTHYLAGKGPAVVQVTPATPAGSPLPEVTVASVPTPAKSLGLCTSLSRGR